MSHFKLKEIEYFNRKVKILCQNSNGPCPLLSLCNVLILNGKIRIHSDYEQVSLDMITQLIANELLEKELSSDITLEMKEMLQQRLGVAISLLPSLQRGLDVNVKFNNVSSFEYTPELDCFDAFSVPLYHGWIYDTQDRETGDVIRDLSYNHLLFKLVEARGLEEVDEQNKHHAVEIDEEGNVEEEEIQNEHEIEITSLEDEEVKHEKSKNQGDLAIPSTAEVIGDVHPDDSSVVAVVVSSEESNHATQTKDNATSLYHDAKVIENFLSETASQLTYAGLLALHDSIPEGSLCTFFRNNHFSTMLKRERSLYLLVTDLGYANMPNVVWELLDEIDGNTELVDSRFCPISGDPPPPSSMKTLPVSTGITATEAIVDPDFLLALQLSEQISSESSASSSVCHSMPPEGMVGYAQPPQSSPSSSSTPHLTSKLSPSLLDNDEQGLPVIITSSSSSAHQSSGPVSPTSNHFVGQVFPFSGGSSHESKSPSSMTQEEMDHQTALELQCALEREDIAERQAHAASVIQYSDDSYHPHDDDVHHLQNSLSPAALDSYRQAELDYFRQKNQPSSSSSCKKKRDENSSGGQSSSCVIA